MINFKDTVQLGFRRWVLKPVLPLLANYCPVKPNHITLLGAVSGMSVCACLFAHANVLAIALLLLSGLCDSLDGAWARQMGDSTALGGVFDIVSDRLVEFSVCLGLYCIAPEARAFAIILLLGCILICVTTFLVVGIYTENEGKKGFYYSPGLIERPEAFVFFIAMIMMPQYFWVLCLCLSALIVLTVVLHLHRFWRWTQEVA